jgi:hypothetical protein
MAVNHWNKDVFENQGIDVISPLKGRATII